MKEGNSEDQKSTALKIDSRENQQSQNSNLRKDKTEKPLEQERKQITDIRNIHAVINRDPIDIKRIRKKQNE